MNKEQFLAHYGIQNFYHFTDERNLPLIRELRGLHSLQVLRSMGAVPPVPGGNDWSREADARFGGDRYVHLCLFDQHPMEWRARQEGRIGTSRFLQIDPNVILFDGVVFSPGVSNRADVPLLDFDVALEKMDFEVVYTRTNWADPEVQARRSVAKKYEVLVPGTIPLEMIRGY